MKNFIYILFLSIVIISSCGDQNDIEEEINNPLCMGAEGEMSCQFLGNEISNGCSAAVYSESEDFEFTYNILVVDNVFPNLSTGLYPDHCTFLMNTNMPLSIGYYSIINEQLKFNEQNIEGVFSIAVSKSYNGACEEIGYYTTRPEFTTKLCFEEIDTQFPKEIL